MSEREPLRHWTGRAMCPYCQEAAHRDDAKIRAHMIICRAQQMATCRYCSKWGPCPDHQEPA